MGSLITGNFSADGDSEEFVATKFLITLGTDTNDNFNNGTVELKVKLNDQLDWTTDSTTFTSADVFKQDGYLTGARFKLTMTGSTSPNVDYAIKYE